MFVISDLKITECCVGMLCLLSNPQAREVPWFRPYCKCPNRLKREVRWSWMARLEKDKSETKRRYIIIIYLHSWTIPVGCMRCSLIHHVFDDLKFFSIRAQRTCQHWNQLFVQILVLVRAFLAPVTTKLWMHIAGPTAIKLQAIQVQWWRNDHQHPSLLKPACLWTEDSSSCRLLMGAYLQAYISCFGRFLEPMSFE